MQNTITAIQRRLPDAKITGSGDPAVDTDITLQCTKGYIDVHVCNKTNRVSCLMEAGASLEMQLSSDAGTSMCLNETHRSNEPFRPCSGIQEAIDLFLQGWY